ncbi:MAG: hypothetical protein RL226_949 [Bacteroidota bacterium]
MRKFILFSGLVAFLSFDSAAQCDVGEVEVSISITTDAWGYECYWELYPEGDVCGSNTLLSGGNAAQIGCDGAGQQDATGGNGYANYSTIDGGSVCLPIGSSYTLQFIDDYGDGGSQFAVFQDGVVSELFSGSGSGNTWTFTVGESSLPPYDLPCNAVEVLTNGASTTVNNEDATAQFFEVAPPGGNCGLPGAWCETGISNSVWLYFVAPDNGSYEVSTCNSGTTFDTQVAVWQADDCLSFGTFELVASNDDMIGGCSGANGFASLCYVSCLEAGATYLIQIDGWNGDEGDAEVTVTPNAEPVSLNAQVNSMACALDKGQPGTGSINTYMIGTGEGYTVSWTGPNNYTADTQNIQDLEAGTYTCTATTACGETVSASFEITMPSFLSLSMSLSAPDCPNSGNGAAEPIVTGGSAPYSYEWTGPNGFMSENGTQSNLNEGQYTLVVTDDNGCEYVQNINLVSSNDLALDLGEDFSMCIDVDTELITAPPGYNYLWQDGSQNQFFLADATELGLGEHSIILTMTSDDGCEVVDAVVVSVEICDAISVVDGVEVNIFPNPFNEFMVVSATEKTDLIIYDAAGRCVQNLQVLGTTTIDTHELASGVYTVIAGANVFKMIKH